MLAGFLHPLLFPSARLPRPTLPLMTRVRPGTAYACFVCLLSSRIHMPNSTYCQVCKVCPSPPSAGHGFASIRHAPRCIPRYPGMFWHDAVVAQWLCVLKLVGGHSIVCHPFLHRVCMCSSLLVAIASFVTRFCTESACVWLSSLSFPFTSPHSPD